MLPPRGTPAGRLWRRSRPGSLDLGSSWRWCLAGGLLAVNAFLVLDGLLAKLLLYDLATALCTAAIVLGARRRRAPGRAAWYSLATGAALLLLAHVVLEVYDLRQRTVPQPSLVDVFHLGAYVFLTAGFVGFVRRRSPENDWQTLIDAAIVGVGAGLGSWLLWCPSGSRHGGLAALVAFSYPALDVLLIGVCVRLAFAFGVLNAAAWLGLASLALLFVTSGAFTSSHLEGGYVEGGLVDAGFLGSYVLGAAAALHPRASVLTERDSPIRERELARTLLVAGAALLAPIMLVVRGEQFGLERVRVIAAAATLLTLLALLRIGLVVLSRAREASRELALRRSATGLLSAQDERSIAGIVVAAVSFWAPQATDARLYLLRQGRLEPVAAAALRPLPQEAVELLDATGVVHLAPLPPVVRAGLDLHATAEEVLLLPVAVAGRLVGALLVGTRGELTWEARAGLRMVCAQAGRALAGARSSARLELESFRASFRDLVESSEDVLLVVDDARTIVYNSPSTLDPLGYEAAALAGTRLTELVHRDDESALTRLLSDEEAAEAIRLRHLDGSWRACLCIGAVPVEAPELGGRVLVGRVAPTTSPSPQPST